jgi:hypothetical protein
MSIELATGDSAPAPDPAPRSPSRPRRRRLDPYELAILVTFAAISVWVLALDLWQVVVDGRVWTGTDGVYIVDQLQYLAWIRSAAQHGLVANMFVLRSTPADYFQPAVVISGGLAALGIPASISLLLWKPVAVGATFFAVRAYVVRTVCGVWARRAALLLALFFGSFTVLYGSVSVIGDLFPGFLSWGYTFGLMALALQVAALLAYDSARRHARRPWLAGALGALASLLHPWNGELLIALVVLSELALWAAHGRPRWRAQLPLLARTVLLTALPLLYYVVLGRTDLSWRLARVASRHSFPLGSIVLAIAPLLIPALLAYRRRPRDFLGAANRAWLPVAFVIFGFSASGVAATPLHAFQGITIPLAVLAVEGVRGWDWRRLPLRRPLRYGLAVALLAALTVPATADELATARKLAAPTNNNANFITRDERSALRYLAEAPGPGGVLTRSYLGAAVPGKTGRRTMVGDCLWSQPHCDIRDRSTQALFAGRLSPRQARQFVRTSGARFVLADCHTKADLTRELAPMLAGVRRFGCATVYEIDAPGRPTGPLAQSRGHAPVRAARRQ